MSSRVPVDHCRCQWPRHRHFVTTPQWFCCGAENPDQSWRTAALTQDRKRPLNEIIKHSVYTQSSAPHINKSVLFVFYWGNYIIGCQGQEQLTLHPLKHTLIHTVYVLLIGPLQAKLYLSIRKSSLLAVLLMVAVKALISWYSADGQLQWPALWLAARRRSPGGGHQEEAREEARERRPARRRRVGVRERHGSEGVGRTGLSHSPSLWQRGKRTTQRRQRKTAAVCL